MMARSVYFYGRLMGLWLARRTVPASLIEADYDRLGPGYDEHFTTGTGRHSRRLVDALQLRRGARVLDLASGTGTLALALAERVGPGGTVLACDRSEGMLAVARAKAAAAGLGAVTFVRGDMRDVLAGAEDGAFDAVTCGWAIGYVDPRALLGLVCRKLRAGGVVGLIENARATLWPVRTTAFRVARTLPGHVRQVMDLHLRLPRDAKDLGRWFEGAGLRPLRTWEGEEAFAFRRGRDVLDWVLHTGASAGFDRVMDPAVREDCDRLFVRFIEEDFLRDGAIRCAHRYVAGMARKEN